MTQIGQKGARNVASHCEQLRISETRLRQTVGKLAERTIWKIASEHYLTHAYLTREHHVCGSVAPDRDVVIVPPQFIVGKRRCQATALSGSEAA